MNSVVYLKYNVVETLLHNLINMKIFFRLILRKTFMLFCENIISHLNQT